jgi:hypothetical protein
VAVISFIKGLPPIIAVEFARRNVPQAARPTFKEMETHCRGGSHSGGGAAAPTA